MRSVFGVNPVGSSFGIREAVELYGLHPSERARGRSFALTYAQDDASGSEAGKLNDGFASKGRGRGQLRHDRAGRADFGLSAFTPIVQLIFKQKRACS
jgi:hypothetical protein